MEENYEDVVQQLKDIGCEFRPKDLPLKIGSGRKTCGKGGKHWYKLFTFRPRDSSRRFVVGTIGSWRSGLAVKVDWDREGLSEETRAQFKADQEKARERERQIAQEAAAFAAMNAAEMWAVAVKDGISPYLQRKGVHAESCRFIARDVWLARRDRDAKRILLPAGTLVVPLIRYDKPREDALRGLQFIKPDGFKLFTEGFGKSGCSVRLGAVEATTRVVLVCEGYATGLSIRWATGMRWPVYVALDAYNLAFVVQILRELHPEQHLLVCADDDWKTEDHDGPNPGRNKARKVARVTERCEIVWPVFNAALRQPKDTDYNDLQQREGIDVVARQLVRVLEAIESGFGRRSAR